MQPPEVPPQVDAITFWNRSLFIVTNNVLLPFTIPTPYEAQSVVFWTNNGTMVGLPGFKFERIPNPRHLTAAQRRKKGAMLPKPSAVFYNDGEITVSDYLLVHASQFQNPGLIAGDVRSRMRFNVTNGLADFSRGAVHSGDLPQPFCTTPTNFIFGPFFFGLDPAVSYTYLSSGIGGSVGTNRFPIFLPGLTDSNFFFNGLFAPPNPVPPFSEYRQIILGTNLVTNILTTVQSCGAFEAFVHLQTNVSFFFTNIFGTNFFIRDRDVSVVFVPTNGLSSNVTIGVAFPTNGLFSFANSPIVEFRAAYFDVISQQQTTNFLTFRDDGASIFRGHDCAFDTFEPPNAPFSNNLFYDQDFNTTVVADYFYTVAQAHVGETNSVYFTNAPTGGFVIFPALGTSLAASNPTNRPGTVRIDARDLDLSNARIRAENGIFIKATNLVGNANSFIDSPFVSFEAGAASGRLVISNLMRPQVNRLQADLNSWAASWSLNETNGFVTNIVLLTNGTFTNIVTPILEAVNYHVLILGACVDALHPSIIHDLTLRATNIVIQDQLAINQSLLLEGRSLTFGSNSSLMLPRGANLAFTNLQRVTTFTNEGVLNVPDGAYFGTFEDGYVPPKQRRKKRNAGPQLVTYENFVNHGVIAAATVSARAAYVEVSGRPFSPSLITATNGPVKLDGAALIISDAVITASSDIRLTAGDALISRSSISAGSTNGGRFMNTYLPGALILDATNSLTDGGVGASNDWRVTTGVRLVRRPNPPGEGSVGDLMGTRIVVRSGTFGESTIQWAGEDRGATVEGFSDNLALGRLVLDGAIGNLFHFQTAQSPGAIYVDYLELLNAATNYNFALGVDPDFTIYFGDSNILPEKLEEVGGGRIRWVSEFTGPQSSTNLVYPNGVTYTFNAGVVRSRDRDDDSDGLVNAVDCTPLLVPGVDTTQPCAIAPALARAAAISTQNISLSIALGAGNREVILNWDAPAHSANAVEFSDSLVGGTWQTLTNFINGPVDARVTVKDAAGAPLRVYRVRVDAGKP